MEPQPSTLRSAQLPASETRSILPPVSGVSELEDVSGPRSIDAWDLMVDPEDVPPETVRTGRPMNEQASFDAERRFRRSPVAESAEKETMNSVLRLLYEVEVLLKNVTQSKEGGYLQRKALSSCLRSLLELTAESSSEHLLRLDEILRPFYLRVKGNFYEFSHLAAAQKAISAWLDERQVAEHRDRITGEKTRRPAA